MSIKIYLIKHIDTGMGYVGVTSRDLLVRWREHHSDSYSALYEILRTDSHRMTMELLEEFEDRDQALKAEQQYIHKLGTAQPDGWNRQVTYFYQGDNGWMPYYVPLRYENDNSSTKGVPTVCCPICGMNRLSMYGIPDIRRRSFECAFICSYCHRNSHRRIKGPRGGYGTTIVTNPRPYTLIINLDGTNGDFHIGMFVTQKKEGNE